MLSSRGWLRHMTEAEKRRWWAIVATGDLDLAIREFRREQAADARRHPFHSYANEDM